jgi:hypothetical protein
MTIKIYLQTILFFEFTFDIFIIVLINKIELGLTMFTKRYTCKISFNHCYKIAYMIWINKLK